MLVAYPVMFIIDDSNVIKKVKIPDLDLVFNVDNKNATLLLDLKKKIKDHILDKRVFVIPKKLKYYKSLSSELNDKNSSESYFWSKVYVDLAIDKKLNLFRKAIPIIGIIANLVTAICFAIAALISARLTAGEDNRSSTSLSLIGSFIYFFIYIMVFFKSGAIKNLSTIGEKLDEKLYYLTSKKNQNPVLLEQKLKENYFPRSKKHSSALIVSSLGMGTLLTTNAIMSAITTYQQTVALGQKAELEHYAFVNNTSILILAWITVIANSIDSLAFQGSFGKELILNIDKYLYQVFPLVEKNTNLQKNIENQKLIDNDKKTHNQETGDDSLFIASFN